MRSISIVIPVYNEEEIVQDRISYLIPELRNSFQNIDVILSENWSTDNTKEIIKELSSKWREISAIIDDGIADYGQALIKGIYSSKYDEVSILELDYLDLDFPKRSYNLLSDFDFIIGSKRINKNMDKRPFKRKFFTYLYNFLLRRIFNLKLTDTHGLKTFKKSKIGKIIKKCVTKHSVFPSELVIRADRDKDCKICEIPLSLPLIEVRKTRINPTKRLKKTIDDLILLRKVIKNDR